MWLLDTSNLSLKQFTKANTPGYAILSHAWGSAEEEISFHDLRRDRDTAQLKAGYSKVRNCCLRSAQDGFQYAWIDTCCIDKRSSAELSEAINSMFKWYQDARVCYVYLADVPSSNYDPSPEVNNDMFSQSRWFTRGWTLQELIAPRCVQFFSQEWTLIGTKEFSTESIKRAKDKSSPPDPFLLKLSRITNIRPEIFLNPLSLRRTSIAQRMSWAAHRHTTREEDTAYALMGLFDIHMPILYGEGQLKAFKRLQSEIIKSSLDQSIFAWRADEHDARETSGLLADSPHDFARSAAFQPWNPTGRGTTVLPYSMTNMGLAINLPVTQLLPDAVRPEAAGSVVLASLGCWVLVEGSPPLRLQVYLRRIQRLKEKPPVYRRERCGTLEMVARKGEKAERRDIYVLEEEQLDLMELIDNLYVIDGGNGEEGGGRGEGRGELS